MEEVRQYCISVISAALICALLSCLVTKGSGKDLIRLLCGIFLAVTIIRPVSQINFDALIHYSLPYTQDAEEVAAQGEKMAADAMAEIIKAKSEAYILDKAAVLNAELDVSVIVSQEGIPVSAELHGNISPYVRHNLASILETDLGITKEHQTWTG